MLGLLTLLHTVASLGTIAAGFGVLYGMMSGRSSPGWTNCYLALALASTLSGYAFPSPQGVTPAHVVGGVTLLALGLAGAGLYGFGLRGEWRRTYVLGAVAALYLHVFVGMAQAFQKIPEMKALAPTQTEAPFGLVQGGVLLLFVYLGRKALLGFLE